MHCTTEYYNFKYLLTNLPNNSKTIEVASTTLCTERFLKRYNDAGDVVSVPNWPKYTVSKPWVKCTALYLRKFSYHINIDCLQS